MATKSVKKKNQKERLDSALARAQEEARVGLQAIAHEGEVGAHVGVRAEGERLVTHLFECDKPGYVGWRWAATLARAPRSRKVTVCELGLLPGADALLAPAWVPWAKRLLPGDIGREDVLPYEAEDERLAAPQDVAAQIQDELAGQPWPGLESGAADPLDSDEGIEVGLGRARVLSIVGRNQAAQRWYASAQGPVPGSSGRTPTCSGCGFLLKMGGSMRTVFGVCANEWSPDDGKVVSLDHSCGAHSETDIPARGTQWPIVAPRLNEYEMETFVL